MRDNLPKTSLKVENLIVNLDSNDNPGTHWVAIKKNNNLAFYFDSFGNLPPPLEIVQYLKGTHIKYNTARFQNFNTEICGHLCLAFLLT